MKRVEAWHTLREMWNDVTPEQKEALGIAMDDIEFVDLMRGHGVPLTNAQHIRSMTDDELADVFGSLCVVAECKTVDGNVCPFYSDCPIDRLGDSLWLNWLKQPYKEEV